MTTLTINAGAATSLQMAIESGEVKIAGIPGAGQIAVTYGYFAGNEEVLQDRGMDPELQADASAAIVLRQTPDQAHRATKAQAHIRLQLNMPARMSLGPSQMESATLSVQEICGVELAMKSGTLDAADNSGQYSVTVTSGTVRVASPAPGFHHQITLQSGTIVLEPGVLLPLVDADVQQGVIQGGSGQLEHLGVSGWKLTPLHPDPRSSVQCRVVSGSISIGEA
jgi:hypothetical protein